MSDWGPAAMTEGTAWRKAISPGRDRLQSRVLVTLAVPWLVIEALLRVHAERGGVLAAAGISLGFALLVSRLRAATPAAASCGGLICFLVMTGTAGRGATILHTGLLPLVALFALTFAATRLGRQGKPAPGRGEERRELGEERRGRTASQVVANLATAAFAVSWTVSRLRFGPPGKSQSAAASLLSVVMLAALVEATADTVSSEIGQAFGGTPFLLTTLARVPPGTDGAISLRGTAAGLLAGLLVTATGALGLDLDPRVAVIALCGGISGFLFDSLLGATAERRGLLGNDLVNFSSTVFAAVVALGLLLL